MTTVAELRVKFAADMGNVERAFDRVDNRLHQLERSSGSARGGLGNLFSVAGGNILAGGIQMATRGLMDLGRASLGVLADSVRMSTGLNAQVSTIGALAGASTEEMGKLKGLINDLGIDPHLKVTSQEAADAIQMLIKNGLEIPQVMNGAARSTVLLSNATGADFSTAADVATSAMSQFGIKAEDMGQAVNGITSVVTNSKLDINDYRLALAQAGGIAGLVGVEFDDFNTMLASTAYMFGSGSDQATSFKTFLQRLVPQSDEAAAAMQQLGLMTADGTNAFFDASGALKDQSEIAGLLNNALGDLSEKQKINYLTTVFGADGMRMAGAIMKQTTQQVDEYKKKLAQTDAEKIAARNMDNLAGDMEIFSGTVEAAKTQLGDKLQPALRKVFQSITPLVAELTPQLTGLANQLATTFVVPAVDGFVTKLREANELATLVFGVTGDATGTFLAGLSELTGGKTTVDLAAKIVTVDWGEGVFTYTYNAIAEISETSVLWGAWTHSYNAKALINENSVLWGAWTHSYNATSQVDEKSVGWGFWTHEYDAKAKISENSILWGFVKTEVDATGKIVDVKIGSDFKMPELPAIVHPEVEKVLAGEGAQNLSLAQRLTIRFAPGVMQFLQNFHPFGAGVTGGGATVAGMPLLSSTGSLPQVAPKIEWPPLPAWSWPTMPAFTWPSLPGWSWPDLPTFAWPTLPTFTWPTLPAWTWPSIPTPGWLSTMLAWRPSIPSWLGGGAIGQNAKGTNSWRGGWSWVGEKGPELVNLPKGAQVLSNAQSKGMIGQLATGTMGDREPLDGPAWPTGASVSGMSQRPQSFWGQTANNLFGGNGGKASDNGANRAAETYKKASEKLSKTFTDVGKKFGDGIKDLKGALSKVPGLFGTSQVTADQMKLADLGVPQNFADDYVRRLSDEVINGVDWEGVDIKDAAVRAGIDPNLPAEAILEMFKGAWSDSSLFAGGANTDLINMDAVKESIARQAASESGQASIYQLFGITPEQATGQAQQLGGTLRTGLNQGLLTGAGADTGAGTALVDGIAAEVAKPEYKEKLGGAMNGLFTGFLEDKSSLSEVSSAIMGRIAEGFANVEGIDMVGKFSSSLMAQLTLDDSVKTLMDIGAKILAYVFDGYTAAAKERDWPGATVWVNNGNGPQSAAPPVGKNAGGTSFWRGGLTWVGEKGAELVSLPQGARVYNNQDSMAMAGTGGPNITIHANVASNIDIQSLAYQVADVVQRRRR